MSKNLQLISINMKGKLVREIFSTFFKYFDFHISQVFALFLAFGADHIPKQLRLQDSQMFFRKLTTKQRSLST